MTSRNEELRSFEHSLPMALLRAREVVMDKFRQHLRAHDVTEQQWRVLRGLANSGPLSASQLSRLTLISLPSLSRIIRSLSERELIERDANTNDLRSIILRLSDNGQSLIKSAGPESERIYAQIATRFGEERLEQLYTLLNALETELTDL